MKPELKQEWIAALRSGEYKQARSVLEEPDENGVEIGNCCLGVLCNILPNIVIKRGIHAHDPSSDYSKISRYFEFVLDDHFMDRHEIPPLTLKWLGISQEHSNVLISMNDSGSTFSEIADHIETNL